MTWRIGDVAIARSDFPLVLNVCLGGVAVDKSPH